MHTQKKMVRKHVQAIWVTFWSRFFKFLKYKCSWPVSGVPYGSGMMVRLTVQDRFPSEGSKLYFDMIAIIVPTLASRSWLARASSWNRCAPSRERLPPFWCWWEPMNNMFHGMFMEIFCSYECQICTGNIRDDLWHARFCAGLHGADGVGYLLGEKCTHKHIHTNTHT